jgi:hypothetical protein
VALRPRLAVYANGACCEQSLGLGTRGHSR